MLRIIALLIFAMGAWAQSPEPYAPAAGKPGTTAIHRDSTLIRGWLGACRVQRGFLDIANPAQGKASFGDSSAAAGMADGNVVSLGDSGVAEYQFSNPISDQPGAEFAIFENALSDNFLELAFVEVSSDGQHFVRFPAVSLTPDSPQVSSFGSLEPTQLRNFAGKYRVDYGVPFDLAELSDSNNINLQSITHLRIVDVIGAVAKPYTTYDNRGNAVNDPYPTAFSSGGFDLDAVALLAPSSMDLEQHRISQSLFYPNPSEGIISLHAQVASYKIMSLDGAVLKNGNAGNKKLVLNQLQPGTYILELTTKDGKVHRQKLLQH